MKSNEKVANIVAVALGVIMFMFGFLKFFDPFNSWFHAQIAGSHLPSPAFALGIAGEMAIGIAFLVSFVASSHLLERVAMGRAAISRVIACVVAMFEVAVLVANFGLRRRSGELSDLERDVRAHACDVAMSPLEPRKSVPIIAASCVG